ncbi:MAG TPA: flagellar motor protein MotB [Bryobacteraceae bacterium]|nr:flagellar motor protein MotB [Bryobacteraceae bacterium]
MNAKVQPVVIIKRKKRPHGGHYGGAWKVAYADFVTAMMSLFIVLWLLSSSDQVRRAVGGYFTDPRGSGKDVGNGLRGAGGESLTVNKDDMSKLRDKLALAIKDSPALQKIRDQVLFTVTSEGLRIEMLEGEKSTFFESGNAQPTEFGKDLLGKLAEEIGKLPNTVMIEGHTDSRLYGGQDYSNWELSADRANSARRWMQRHGMRSDQVKQVRGYADESPRTGVAPDDPSNRRITVIIQYQPVTKAEIGEAAGPESEPAGGKPDAKPEAGPERPSPLPRPPPKK